MPRDSRPDGRTDDGEANRLRSLPHLDLTLPVEPDSEEEGDEESTIYLLDEQAGWALMLPEGIILHAHGPADGADDEEVFVECEPVEGPAGEPLLRCAECGATLDEAALDMLWEEQAE